MDAVHERISAAVRDHCQAIGLNYVQTRAAVNAALNQYGQDAAELHPAEAETQETARSPLPNVQDRLAGRAIGEGNRIADELARESQHG